MTDLVMIHRRLFLARLGKGTFALVIFGACGPDSGAPTTTATTGPEANSTTSSTAPIDPSTTTGATSTTSSTPQFLRVNLGFVSAYIVVRGSEAAVVDTGVSESEGAIAAALMTTDLGWDAVGHVVLTHHHSDHVGSMPAVLAAAPSATAYIGEADLDNVFAPRELVALSEGDKVFGLTVIATPGHTAGHISLLDTDASVLFAGDALNGDNGGVVGPDPQFSEDHNQALATVGKMAGFEYEAIYFGHGEPVLQSGSALVGDLAGSL